MVNESIMFALEEKVICEKANDTVFLKQNETYTIIGFDNNHTELCVKLKGIYIIHSITKEKLYPIFKISRFKKLPHMIAIEEQPIWWEVYSSSEEEGTETIETFDTEQEAIDFIGDNQELDYDKWTVGADGTNVRIQ